MPIVVHRGLGAIGHEGHSHRAGYLNRQGRGHGCLIGSVPARRRSPCRGAAPFAPMPGRTMKDWVVLPKAVVADDEALDAWVARAGAFAASLPPKR